MARTHGTQKSRRSHDDGAPQGRGADRHAQGRGDGQRCGETGRSFQPFARSGFVRELSPLGAVAACPEHSRPGALTRGLVPRGFVGVVTRHSWWPAWLTFVSSPSRVKLVAQGPPHIVSRDCVAGPRSPGKQRHLERSRDLQVTAQELSREPTFLGEGSLYSQEGATGAGARVATSARPAAPLPTRRGAPVALPRAAQGQAGHSRPIRLQPCGA